MTLRVDRFLAVIKKQVDAARGEKAKQEARREGHRQAACLPFTEAEYRTVMLELSRLRPRRRLPQ